MILGKLAEVRSVNAIRKRTPVFLHEPVSFVVRRARLRMIDRVLGSDFPAVLREPVRYLASKRASPDVMAVQAKVESLRAAMLRRGDDSMAFPRGEPRSLDHVASTISIDRVFGTFLHMCARSNGAKTVLELGTAAGLGSCYLAMAPACERFIGLDVAPDSIAMTRSNLGECVEESRLELIEATFDEGLEMLFEDADLRFDFVWLDADHYTDSTLRHFEHVKSRLAPGAIVAVDDIRLYREMFAAWETLRTTRGFSHMVDVGRVAVGLWEGGDVAPRQWTLNREIMWPWPSPDDDAIAETAPPLTY